MAGWKEGMKASQPQTIANRKLVMPTDWKGVVNYPVGSFVSYADPSNPPATYYCKQAPVSPGLAPPLDPTNWAQWSTTAFADVPTYQTAPPVTYGIFDTTQFPASGAGFNGYPTSGLKAIQITLRVWDNASRQSRQMSIIQDL